MHSKTQMDDKLKSSKADQATVKSGILKGAVVLCVVSLLGYFFSPFRDLRLPSAADRVLFTLKWQSLSMLTLLWGIRQVGRIRFSSKAIDPTHPQADALVDVPKRYLQNTLEQLIFSIFGQLILSIHLTNQAPRVIPVLVCLFVIGRIMFWIGYSRDPMKRAPGFFMTFAPNLAMCFLNVGFLFWELFSMI